MLIDLSPYKHDGPGGDGPPSWVHKVPLPDINHADAQHVDDIIKQTPTICGFIAESMPSVGGQIVLPPGYLNDVYKAVRNAGGVCIADEVQTGYGRIGTHFWGFESYGVVPDVVVLGKPIGNGHPIGAVITTRAIADSFDQRRRVSMISMVQNDHVARFRVRACETNGEFVCFAAGVDEVTDVQRFG